MRQCVRWAIEGKNMAGAPRTGRISSWLTVKSREGTRGLCKQSKVTSEKASDLQRGFKKGGRQIGGGERGRTPQGEKLVGGSMPGKVVLSVRRNRGIAKTIRGTKTNKTIQEQKRTAGPDGGRFRFAVSKGAEKGKDSSSERSNNEPLGRVRREEVNRGNKLTARPWEGKSG